MFPTGPQFTFGSFLAAFPFPLFCCVATMMFVGTGKYARKTHLSRTFLISFWIFCWAAAGGATLTVWHMQSKNADLQVQETAHSSVSYYEQNGYTAVQALHYHYAMLASVHRFQALGDQAAGQILWYGMLFLVLPVIMYGIGRRRGQMTPVTG